MKKKVCPKSQLEARSRSLLSVGIPNRSLFLVSVWTLRSLFEGATPRGEVGDGRQRQYIERKVLLEEEGFVLDHSFERSNPIEGLGQGASILLQ